MNTIWLKIVAVVVVVVVAIVLFSKIANHKPAPEQPQKTLGDTFREDEKRLRAEPNIVESNVPASAEQPKFRELTEEENAGASQLFELAITQRKMGRLPAMRYGAMVQYCRQIIEKYPGSEYAYKAKRMLADIPASDRERYHITDDEINLNK
ncbi:MAG: hypothetical protein ABR913_03680 [Sedimentisphaerales bacterium]